MSDIMGPIASAIAAGAAADEHAGASSHARMKAFNVMRRDGRERQMVMYGRTTYALRDEALVPVAPRQHDTLRRVATESIVERAEDAHVDLPAHPGVVGQSIAPLVDGLMLAWLVHPATTDVDEVLALVDVGTVRAVIAGGSLSVLVLGDVVSPSSAADAFWPRRRPNQPVSIPGAADRPVRARRTQRC